MYNLVKIHNNIAYIKDVITRPDLLINFLEETDNDPQYYNSISQWQDWYPSDSKNFVYGKQKFINLAHETGNEKIDNRVRYIINSIDSAVFMCTANYAQHFNIPMQELKIGKDFAFKKYFTGSYMGPHQDAYGDNAPLRYSIVVYLNNDYEGGEINFPDHDFMIKPEAGSMVIFPSDYRHESKLITNGNKYMVPAFWYK